MPNLLRSSRRRCNLIPRSHSVPLSQLVIALSTTQLCFRFTLLLKLLLLLHMLLRPLLLLSQLRLSHVPCRGSIVSQLLLRLLPLLLLQFSLLLTLCCPLRVTQGQPPPLSDSLGYIRIRRLGHVCSEHKQTAWKPTWTKNLSAQASA